MPDWTYHPLRPIAAAVLGERRTQVLALRVLTTLVTRLGSRRWIPVVFEHPAVISTVGLTSLFVTPICGSLASSPGTRNPLYILVPVTALALALSHAYLTADSTSIDRGPTSTLPSTAPPRAGS